LSGGVAKTTTTQTVVIANPINLPIILKRQYLPLEFWWCFCWCKQSKYWINGSAKVAKLTKLGAEVWAGSTIELAAPYRFSTKKVINESLVTKSWNCG
jgi:hypothetical protein